MKILFTGGGTGGHFYPIIAVAEAVRSLADREQIVDLELFYMSDDPYNHDLLARNHISYVEVKSGKLRTYFSIKNLTDPFKVVGACIKAIWKIFLIYPDIVFGKGGYASFPALFAARFLRIPVMIHESDISPGRVNRWFANYAKRVAISYPETKKYFQHQERVALTGIPVRTELLAPPTGDPFATLGLSQGIPTILVLGGSQGAESINEHLMDIIDRIVGIAQVIHQTGEVNYEWMKKRATGMLDKHPNRDRYHPFAYLDTATLRLAASASDFIISRAGSTIFEIALWGKASILIPLPIAREDHQRENAYSYARTGAAEVIEEQNLKPELFFSVITQLIDDPARREKMAHATGEFAHTDAAEKIAQALINFGLDHAHPA